MAPASSSPRSGAPAPSHSTAWRPQGSPAYGRLESIAVDQGPPGPSVALVPCAPSPHQRTPGRPHAVHAARQVAAGLARTHALQLALDLIVHVVLHLKHIEPVDCSFSRTRRCRGALPRGRRRRRGVARRRSPPPAPSSDGQHSSPPPRPPDA
jgi:hypothetical protein